MAILEDANEIHSSSGPDVFFSSSPSTPSVHSEDGLKKCAFISHDHNLLWETAKLDSLLQRINVSPCNSANYLVVFVVCFIAMCIVIVFVAYCCCYSKKQSEVNPLLVSESKIKPDDLIKPDPDSNPGYATINRGYRTRYKAGASSADRQELLCVKTELPVRRSAPLDITATASPNWLYWQARHGIYRGGYP
jgi:hypothetical protein